MPSSRYRVLSADDTAMYVRPDKLLIGAIGTSDNLSKLEEWL